MPYGLASAPEVFQEEVDNNFGNIPNCIVCIDVLISFGETEEEHVTAVHKALREIKLPKNVKELQLQCILGMLNYVRPFLNNMSDVEKPLQELRKADTLWQWLPHHEVALKRLKETICQAPCLHNFDPALPITVQCDASQTGLGVCLLQERQPVVLTDHKPLVPLMTKPIGKIGSTRLKRLRSELLPYDLSVMYLLGKEISGIWYLGRTQMSI
ncbi:hypothetical protein PR048_006563 [Dryococelus australis]|uniref:Reverse transcriptase/retrotransposon-derived protein RNase H-like domain-containing protein n=1 Tax=Dryococelus australis TaxID=614101 RepID=A0ABQ9IC00_9NEOP|nr:hypothetical protein PR048_006563 [Dryococelus australis]